MKAATCFDGKALFYYDISIHAAREGGDQQKQENKEKEQISIHAAREGGDYLPTEVITMIPQFQSTPPVKAATLLQKLFVPDGQISIHAAREGGDHTADNCNQISNDFNPRRP